MVIGTVEKNKLDGKRINNLTVLKRAYPERKGKSTYYLCRCDCGNEKVYAKHLLIKGEITSCGCHKKPFNPTEYQRDYQSKLRMDKKGFLESLYYAMQARSKNKGFGKLPFTLKEFLDRYLLSYEYVKLFEDYKEKGFIKPCAPSVDRINPRLGYFFENMQFITWKENEEKGKREMGMLRGVNVDLYDKETNEKIMQFNSIKEVHEYTGISKDWISRKLSEGNGECFIKKYRLRRVHSKEEPLDIYSLVKDKLGR